MHAVSGRSWSAVRWIVGSMVLAVALVSVSALPGQTQPAASQPAAADNSPLKALTRIPGVTAVLPTDAEKKPQVILFIAGPSAAGESFERQLGAKEDLPRLASELGAVLLFAVPPAAGAGVSPDVKQLQADLRKAVAPSAANRYGLTVAGCGTGAPAAMMLFARDASLADALVLVNPDPPGDAAATEMGKSLSEARPCVILASPAATKGAEAAKAALTKRTEKADIVEAELADGSAFPLAHVATVMRWTTPAATLRRGQSSLAAAPVPASGPARIEALKSLLELQAVAAQVAAGLEAPVSLKEMAAAPAVAKTDEFFTALQERFKLLEPIGKDVEAKAAKKLEAAKEAATKQVPAIQASLMKAPAEKREAARKKFQEENFPWPDLLPELPAAVTEQQFVDVMKAKCVRCHARQTASVQDGVKARWIVPGKPESSPTYTIIGVHKKPGAKYHNLTDEEKKIVHDFIQQMPAR